MFGTSSGPVKVPVATAAHVDNPKHAFSPSPAVKVVKYTLTAPGGKTTVVEAQGSWSHPGEPKRAFLLPLSRSLALEGWS